MTSNSIASVAALVLLAGCGSDAAPPLAGNDPQVIAVDGDPNGLFWHDAEQKLYVADDNGNRILEWTDSGGFALVSDLPAAPTEGAGLGQLVVLDDGTIVVTRFGYGTAGDVAFVSPDGSSEIVPNLDPERRRIGLTVADDGTLFDSWFVRLESGARVGAIGRLDLEGEEVEVVTGLMKPVGVLAVEGDLFISDQDLGQILKGPLDDPASYAVLGTLDAPDLLAAGPDGSLFSGSAGGSLYRIGASGETSVVETGFQQVRGVAYDPTGRRIFVADHDPDEGDGIEHFLHVLPAE